MIKLINPDDLIVDSHVTNPYKKKKKKKKNLSTGKISFSQIEDVKHHKKHEDINIEDWKNKDFIFWFTKCLNDNFPSLPDYNIVYNKDGKNIKVIQDAFKKSGYENQDVKIFIEHIVSNYAQNVLDEKEESGKLPGFTTSDLIDFINGYIQHLQISKEKDGVTHSACGVSDDELESCLKESGLLGLLRNYGIPIAASFIFEKIKDESVTNEQKIEKIKNVFSKNLIKLDPNTLEKIAKHSVFRGPYDDNFILLDWQKEFHQIWCKSAIQKNIWWEKTYR